MNHPKLFVAVLFVVLSSHIYLLAQVKVDQHTKTNLVKSTTQPLKLSVVKIKIKQKEIKKVKKKIIKKKPKKKKKKKVIKKKVIKKTKPLPKPIEKVVEKPIEKVVEKEVEKPTVKPRKLIVPTVTKKQPIIKKKPTLSLDERKAIEQEYLLELKNLIEKSKFYPRRAKRLKQVGTVVVSFRILADGTFSNISLKDECKFTRLNKAALQILQKLKTFRKIPHKLKKNSWDITIPIEYKIIS